MAHGMTWEGSLVPGSPQEAYKMWDQGCEQVKKGIPYETYIYIYIFMK